MSTQDVDKNDPQLVKYDQYGESTAIVSPLEDFFGPALDEQIDIVLARLTALRLTATEESLVIAARSEGILLPSGNSFTFRVKRYSTLARSDGNMIYISVSVPYYVVTRNLRLSQEFFDSVGFPLVGIVDPHKMVRTAVLMLLSRAKDGVWP